MSEPTEKKASPQKTKERSSEDLVWETLSMCLRATVVVAFLGLVMWWGFQRDQNQHPQARLNPMDVAYIRSSQAATFQTGEFDDIFRYPEMIDFYRDDAVLHTQDTQVGSFLTRDGLERVHDFYHRRLNSNGLSTDISPLFQSDKQKQKEGEWMLTAADFSKKTQYSVRAIKQPDGMTRVFFQKNTLREDSGGNLAARRESLGDNLPVPPGRYETYEIATSPGSMFGITRNYLSDQSVDGNFAYFNHQLQRLGWTRSTLDVPEHTSLGGRSGLYRKGMNSCLLNIAPHDGLDWQSIVSLTVF